jgi:hypothetical protein
MEKYLKQIKTERTRLQKLNSSILEMENLIADKNNRFGGTNAAIINNTFINQQIQRLENLIDKTKCNSSDLVYENNQLREKIESERHERVVYDKLYYDLEVQFQRKQEEIGSVITEIQYEMKENEASSSSLSQLKEKANHSRESFHQELQYFSDFVKNYSMKKDQERSVYTASQISQDFSEVLPDKSCYSMKNSLNNTSIVNHQPQQQNQQYSDPTGGSMMKSTSSETSFTRLLTATNSVDSQEAIHKFLESENHNYDMMNEIHNTDLEIEKLGHEIKEMKEKISTHQIRQMTINVNENKCKEELQQKVEILEDDIAVYEEQYTQRCRQLKLLEENVYHILNILGIKWAEHDIKDDDNHHDRFVGNDVSGSDLVSSLGLIEHSVTEIGIVKPRLIPDMRDDKWMKGMSPDEAEEIDQRPFTNDELRYIVEKDTNLILS